MVEERNTTLFDSYSSKGSFAVSLMLVFDIRLKRDVFWDAEHSLAFFFFHPSPISGVTKDSKRTVKSIVVTLVVAVIGYSFRKSVFKCFDKRLEPLAGDLHKTLELQQ